MIVILIILLVLWKYFYGNGFGIFLISLFFVVIMINMFRR